MNLLHIKIKKVFSDLSGTRIAIIALVSFFVFLGMRSLIFLRMAYADFLPFSDNSSLSFSQYVFLWKEWSFGYYEPKGISFIFRFLSEFFSFGSPTIAQSIYTLFFFLVAYFGMYLLLKESLVSRRIRLIVSFFYVYNPITLSEYSNGVTGILIIYSIIPFTFLSLNKLLKVYDFRLGFLFTIFTAIIIFNLQTGFWIIVSLIYFFILHCVYYGINFHNIGKIIPHVLCGVLLNPSAALTFLKVKANFSTVDYMPDFLHNYSRVSFTNLFRISANAGSPLKSLGYFSNTLINLVSVLISLPIFFILFTKSRSLFKNIWFTFAITMLLFLYSFLYLISKGFFDGAIESQNVFIISLRNPQKLLYIVSFVYVLLLGLSLEAIIRKLQKVPTAGSTVLVVFTTLFLLFNQSIFEGDFGLSQTREKGYYISEQNDAYQELLSNLNQRDQVLILPFDYSLQLQNSWNKEVVFSKLGAKKTDADLSGDVLQGIYNKICEGNADLKFLLESSGIRYIVLAKNPISYKNHPGLDCSLEGLYGTPYIWGKFSYFEEYVNKIGFKPEKENDYFVLYDVSSDENSYIDHLDNVFSFDKSEDLSQLASIFSSLNNSYPSKKSAVTVDFDYATSVLNLFSIDSHKFSKVGISSQSISDLDKVYINKSKNSIEIVENGGRIQMIESKNSFVTLDDLAIETTGSSDIIFDGEVDVQYYVKNGLYFGSVSPGLHLDRNFPITIYKLIGENVVSNGSFEDGLWHEDVLDCYDYDSQSDIGMTIADDSIDGDNSLHIFANRHTACTVRGDISLESNSDYLISFNYKGDIGYEYGYFLGTESESQIFERKEIYSPGWSEHFSLLKSRNGEDDAQFYLYAYEDDGNGIYYDDVRLTELELVKDLSYEVYSNFEAVSVPNSSSYTFEYLDPSYKIQNSIHNASLEGGLWQDEVANCRNSDGNSKIGMKLSDEKFTDGRFSLELSAKRHVACTSPRTFSVKSGLDYYFSFDYRGDIAKNAGYHISFDDNRKTQIFDKLEIVSEDWATHSIKINIPDGSTKARLTVYSYPQQGGGGYAINYYDNFAFVELPDIDNRYYVVSDSDVETARPEGIAYESVDPTRKTVTAWGVTKPFYLTMSESYHDKWQLHLDNSRVRGFFDRWVPFVSPDRVSDDKHFKYMTFLNGWYVDPEEICREGGNGAGAVKEGCTLNDDGSYDINMVIEFYPQRWFYLGLLISGFTFVSMMGYVIVGMIRRKHKVSR